MFQKEQAPSPSLREVNCEARRRRILEAARKLIAAGGMAALSMRKLAGEAGVSVTTLYNLVGARDDILAALIDDAIDRIDAMLEREAPLDDPIDRCRAIITTSIRYLADNEAYFRPIVIAHYEGLSFQGTEERRIAERSAAMQTIAIKEAMAQGLLRDVLDPVELGRQVYHGYEMACCQWAFGLIDDTGFRNRAMYGLYVSLLAVAGERLRPVLEAEVRTLEGEMRVKSDSRRSEKKRSA